MTTRFQLGWLRDLPDIRDFEADSTKVGIQLPQTKQDVATWFQKSKATTVQAVPSEVNLIKWFSPVENQLNLGSCTANAGVGLLEYFENRAFGTFVDASRLFLYKVTRNLLGWTGDTGAYLRTTMKAMAAFGVVPEAHLPYDVSKFDQEPSAFAYAYAQDFKSMSYFRLDQAGLQPAQVLQRIKAFIAAGYPSMFGFTVYSFGNSKGEFPFPSPTDKVLGGHAVVAMGYDDSRVIGTCKGALKIRNSWGTGWGDVGYGWLPYDYVLKGLAVDFWSLFRAEYLDTKKFD
ncbi:MAG: C1 family peptidase [Polyangiaceae bacterium]